MRQTDRNSLLCNRKKGKRSRKKTSWNVKCREGGEGRGREEERGRGRGGKEQRGESPRATEIPTNLDITKYVGTGYLRVYNLPSERLVMYVRSCFARWELLLEIM